MKKIIIILFLLIILFIPNIACAEDETISKESIIKSQQETLGISSFIEEAEKYTKKVYNDIDLGELFSSAITGNIDNKTIIKSIVSNLGGEVMDTITILVSIIVIIVIHSILKSISDGLENKGIAQITYYVQFILIVTLIMTNFVQILDIVKDSIQNLVGFMNSLIPIMITLMITTGSIVSANLIQPIILFLITFIGNFLIGIIIPFILISTALGIISKISDRIQIDKISKFFKTSVVWILGVILTVFVGVISIEGTLSSSVDGITAKTAKAAVSSFIPVVGKILGDAVDTVIGCSSILKNATGIVGIIVLIGIAIIPIIKLTIMMTIYYLGAALCQPIADGNIISLLEQMGDTFKILLGIMCTVSVMFIIGTTLVINISNSGMMYR